MFPGNRPANVTPDPELDYPNHAQKVAFPGARPANVTADPSRDGNTFPRKTTPLPFGLPFGTAVTTDPARDGNTSQSHNANLGGESGESGVVGALNDGVVDPEDVQGTRTYVDPEPQATVQDAEHDPAHVTKTDPYPAPQATKDPEH